MKELFTKLISNKRGLFAVLLIVLTTMSFSTTAHTVDSYAASCNGGPQYVVTATVSSVNSTSNYRWQWKNTSGVWVCFVNGTNTINGNSYNISGSVFNLTTTPGPIVFTNPTSGLQNLEIRMVISDGSGVNPCTLPPGNTWTSSSNHYINVNNTACATTNSCTCPGNLVANPSFENGTTSWSWGNGTLSQGTGAVACGTYSGDLNNTSSNSRAYQTIGTDLAIGTTVNASVYAGTHDNSFDNWVAIGFFNASDVQIGSLTQVQVDKVLANAPAGPQLYNITAIVPANTKFTKVLFGGTGTYTKTDQWCVTTSTPVCTGKVTGLYFNKLDGGTDLPISNGTTYTVGQLGSLYNIEAATTGTIGSIKYTITGPTPTTNIENVTPYNSPGTGAGAWTGAVGTYTVNAKTYNNSDANGALCHDTTFTFIVSNGVSLGNQIFNDLNDNGIKDSNESGWPYGMEVNLFLDNNNDGVADAGWVALTTNADGNGFYQFTGLVPGSYFVTLTNPYPVDWQKSSVNGGDPDNDIDNDNNGLTGTATIKGATITLTANAEPTTDGDDANGNQTYDFGMWKGNGLGDYVFLDANANGIQDGGEAGITNVSVTLSKGATTYTTTTDANGYYFFADLYDLANGGYTLTFATPAGLLPSPANQGGDDAKDSDPVGGVITGVQVPIGTWNHTYDAGFYPPLLSLGDRVFSDLNDNGVRDATEVGIEGVVVKLYLDANNDNVADGAALQTAITDASGNYRFNNLSPNHYIVGASVLAGYRSSTLTGVDPDNNIDVDDNGNNAVVAGEVRGNAITLSVGAETLESGNFNHTYDFGFVSEANLGDRVWRDDNKNGVQDAGEPGVSGITISLFDNTNKLIGSTVTDAYGNYLFSKLPTGGYTVSVTLPPNYTFTSSVGTSETDAANSDVNATTGITTTITLSPGENQLNIDAGIIFNIPILKANIGDRVWLDIDKDGNQDAGEPGVAGITVTLFDNTGAIIATAITDVNGNYLFTDVTPGTGYTIGFTAPAGTVFSPKDATADGNDSDADPITGKTAPFTVVAGTTDLSFDAGVSPQTPNKASLGDKVFNDLDRDGIQDPGEPGIAGVTVNLYAANGTTLLGTTKTDAFGNYIFTNLTAGSYVVEFVKPSGFTSSPKDAGTDDAKDSDADATTGKTSSIVLAAGDRNTTVDAGMYVTTPAGLLVLGDKVFNDANRDGVQAATENGVSGVTVTLYQNGVDGLPNTADDVKVKATTTDVNGNYLFTDLAASTGASSNYSVQFSNLPSGYSFTTQDQTLAGGNDANDSDPNTVTGRTGSINLTATNLTVDAGIVQGIPAGKGSLGDRVFYDMPGGTTGVQDPTEQGVAGVLIKLYKDANNDGTISGAETTATATTTTNALGNYMFGGLDAGNYQVGFSNLPAAFTLTTKDAGTDDAKDSDGNPLGSAVAGNTATTGTSYTGLVSIAQGEDKLTVDLGIVPPANTNSLGGDVWKDTNNDGNQTAGEPAVKGVMVTLYDAAGNPIATTVTDDNGKYLFVGLPDGSYSVGFSSLPSGYNFTTQSATNDAIGSDANITTGRTTTVTLGVGNRNDTSLDAGLVTTRAALGNYVWFDTNGNGTQDATESGIAGVTVTLTRPGFGLDGTAGNADDALPVASAITDANGGYFFGNLAVGNYVVNFATIPTNTVFTQQNTPGDNGNNTNSDANPANGNSASIALTAGETDLTIDAGVKPNLPGAVGNFVWNDLDGDGIQDANEPGVAGVLVTLYDGANNPVGSAITDGNGAYLITNVPAGTGYYAIFSNLTSGAVFTTQDQTAGGGNDTNDSDANPTTGRTGSITIVAGETNTTVDAGIRTNNLNLGNFVWYDKNNNGLQDAGELGLVGIPVNLYKDDNADNIPDGAAIATTTTLAGGLYNFVSLTAGNYIVGVIANSSGAGIVPSFTTPTSAAPNNDNNLDNNGVNISGTEIRSNFITLSATNEPDSPVDGDGTNGNLTVDFGIKGTGALGNFVWEDRNRNGIQDAGEPGIVGATVTLTYPDGTTAVTTTGAGGIYSFTDLVPGIYSVRFTTPIPSVGNYIPTISNNSVNDGIDSDPIAGLVANISIAAGEINNTIDAGFIKRVNLSGNVWHDDNALIDNEVNKTSNIPIPVELYAHLIDVSTGLIVRSTLILPDGTYSFNNIPAYTSYKVVMSFVSASSGDPEPQAILPSGWRYTGENVGAGINSGDDGVTDGILFINVLGTSRTNVNFGIKVKNGEVIIG